jgi:O-antigen/teichoic acid export membrane protein
MIRQFFRDSFLYTIPSILSRGIAIFLLPLYTRVLQPGDYGIVDILTVFASFINLTIALEITQAVGRFLPDANSVREKRMYISSAFSFTLIVYGAFALITFVLRDQIAPYIFGQEVNLMIFQWGIVSICVQGIFLCLVNQMKWQVQTKQNVVVNIVSTFGTIIASVVLVLVLRWGVLGIIVSGVIGNSLAVLLSLRFVREDLAWRISKHKLREMLRYSSPLVISSVSIFASLYIDRICLKYFQDMNAVGLYGIGFRLSSVVGLLIIGLQSSLTPLILNKYMQPETPSQIKKLFNLFILGALGCILFMSFFPRELLMLFTTEEYFPAASIVPILTTATLVSNAYLFTPGVIIKKKSTINATISFAAAIVNVVLNVLLIPKYGIVGAASATALSSLGGFFFQASYSQKYYYIPFNWKRIAAAFVLVVVVAISSYYTFLKIDAGSIIFGIVLKGLVLLITAFIAYIILLPVEERKSISKFLSSLKR